MAMNFSTLSELVNKSKTEVTNAVEKANAFLKASFLGAIATAMAGRVNDFLYTLAKNVLPELFLTTAKKSDSIKALVVPFGLNKIAGTISTGTLIGTGTVTIPIPIDTTFQDSNGEIYISTTAVTIVNTSISITSLTQIGGVATATASGHGYYSGLAITVSGANQSGYNGTFSVSVINENSFSYTVDSGTISPATGTILSSVVKAEIPIKSQEVGADKNLAGGESLTISSPISQFDDTVYVKYPAFSGGKDLESFESLRQRGLARYRNPSGHFTVGDIEASVKEDTDNTRVWVQPITPAIGQVTVIFVQDNAGTGTAIIPDSAEVLATKNRLIEISPATIDTSVDLIVAAPNPIIVDFTFTAIFPNTTEMKTAIQNSLTAFFQDISTLGTNITQIEYNSAIINTIDTSGTRLSSFTLSSPTGDITIASNELGILGSITYP